MADKDISKNRNKKHIFIYLCLAVLILFLWVFRPPSSYDKSKIDTRLTSLEEPFKSVNSGYYQDGGSISIIITDKNDVVLEIAIPVIEFDTSYDKVYLGARHISRLEEGTIEVENPDETKLMLKDILHRYSNQCPYNDFILSILRGRVRDYIMILYHKLMGHYGIQEEEVLRVK